MGVSPKESNTPLGATTENCEQWNINEELGQGRVKI